MITTTPLTGTVPVTRAPDRTIRPAQSATPGRALALAGLRVDGTSALYAVPATETQR